MIDRPFFVHDLPPIGSETEPLRLAPEAQAELDEQLRQMDEARAIAIRDAHKVVIWR